MVVHGVCGGALWWVRYRCIQTTPTWLFHRATPPKPYSYIVYLLYYYYYVTVKQMKQVYIEREWVYSYRGRPHQSGG